MDFIDTFFIKVSNIEFHENLSRVSWLCKYMDGRTQKSNRCSSRLCQSA